MASHAMNYAMFWLRILIGLGLTSLLLSLTACVTPPGYAVSPVRCEHPQDIEPYTHEGLALATQAYAEALNLCNTLNGYPLED